MMMGEGKCFSLRFLTVWVSANFKPIIRQKFATIQSFRLPFVAPLKVSKKSGSSKNQKEENDAEDRHQAIISLAYDDWEDLIEQLDIDRVWINITVLAESYFESRSLRIAWGRESSPEAPGDIVATA